MKPAGHEDPHIELRDAVRALCNQYDSAYWQKVDEARGYPDAFVDALTKAGWLAALIPEEYGGSGLSLAAASVIMEEINRSGGNSGACHGQMYNMGTVLRHGSDAQKREYLPRILSGEHRWAQGYSEPGAGSDLASLRTTAVPDGGHYVINGQKTWTTFLDDATHMFLLARTRKDGGKQEGLTIFILNLDSPGVQRRLITTLAGHAELGEVFLDNVRVPAANIVGPLHGGWTAAKDLLEFERINNGSPKLPLYALNQLNAYACEKGLFDDPAFRDRFMRLRLDLQDQYCAYRYFCNRLKSGRTPGPEVSMLKLWSTETYQRLSELFLEVAGEEGVEADRLDVAGSLAALRLYYRSRPSTIYSGSSEVQRNLLAKRVLRLPGAKP